MRVVLTVTAGPHAGAKTVFDGHGTLIVGRSPRATVRMPRGDRFFSRFHFLVEVNPPRCRITDLGSRNGTFVNGERTAAADLEHGDEIKAGHTRFVVAVEDRPADPPPATPPPAPHTGTLRPEDIGSAVPAAVRPSGSDPCRVCGGPADRTRGGYPLCPACRHLTALPPQPFPGYGVVGELGRGAMGVVYKALHLESGAVVAVKTITPAVAVGQADRKRFLREADTLRALRHPRIIAFRDSGEADGRLYFAMDFVAGVDGTRLLKEQGLTGGGLPVKRAVGLALQLLEALEYAHARGYVHRDVKPANLMVTAESGADAGRLADFGLARLYHQSSLSGITLLGPDGIGGTPAFMPPEQITDFRSARPPADLYSAAATLYTLLTARPVFDFGGCDSNRVLLKILQDEPIPVRDRRADIPAGLADAIHRCLAKDPKKRAASAAAFRESLRPFA